MKATTVTVPAVCAKVCGLTRREDAEAAAAAGASFLGAVFAPGGPRNVASAAAADLFTDLPPRRVGVFVNAPMVELLRAADTAGLDVLQLHGDETPEYIEQLREREMWMIWKAVRPRSGSEFRSAVSRYGSLVDGLLVDGWSRAARGGTGARFPWGEVAEQRESLPAGVSLIVAGGLRAGNLARAVALLRPDVVDVSSGVERSPGIKDPAAIHEFMSTVQRLAPDGENRASHV